uniref:Uncharacterized protein n=1 Tax=viral metagenome TaxID=1070528 RepID=A0A6C0CST0_9ZZZZ
MDEHTPSKIDEIITIVEKTLSEITKLFHDVNDLRDIVLKEQQERELIEKKLQETITKIQAENNDIKKQVNVIVNEQEKETERILNVFEKIRVIVYAEPDKPFVIKDIHFNEPIHHNPIFPLVSLIRGNMETHGYNPDGYAILQNKFHHLHNLNHDIKEHDKYIYLGPDPQNWISLLLKNPSNIDVINVVERGWSHHDASVIEIKIYDDHNNNDITNTYTITKKGTSHTITKNKTILKI